MDCQSKFLTVFSSLLGSNTAWGRRTPAQGGGGTTEGRTRRARAQGTWRSRKAEDWGGRATQERREGTWRTSKTCGGDHVAYTKSRCSCNSLKYSRQGTKCISIYLICQCISKTLYDTHTHILLFIASYYAQNDDKTSISTSNTTNSTTAIETSTIETAQPPVTTTTVDTNTTEILTSTTNNDTTNHKSINDYEQSVTDKENALMNSFSNLIENKLLPQQQQQTNNVINHHQENNVLINNKTNGKMVDFDPLADEQNAIIKTAMSNGNGHARINLDNKMWVIRYFLLIFKCTIQLHYHSRYLISFVSLPHVCCSNESGVNVTNNFSDSITGQLLDLTIDSNQTAEHTVNFNNNSLLTSTTLVTSDSHENKGKELKTPTIVEFVLLYRFYAQF